MIEVCSEVMGTVTRVLVREGQFVDESTNLLVVESMKMEIYLVAPTAGVVVEIRRGPSDSVVSGEIVVVLDAE